MIIRNPIGKKGEDIAATYLKSKGYKILERNYRKQYAEIDIIALSQDNVLVFIEVKTRTSHTFGTPFEAITPWKLRPITKLAEYYQMKHPQLSGGIRIDAIGVEIDDFGNLGKIEHLENVSGF